MKVTINHPYDKHNLLDTRPRMMLAQESGSERKSTLLKFQIKTLPYNLPLMPVIPHSQALLPAPHSQTTQPHQHQHQHPSHPKGPSLSSLPSLPSLSLIHAPSSIHDVSRDALFFSMTSLYFFFLSPNCSTSAVPSYLGVCR